MVRVVERGAVNEVGWYQFEVGYEPTLRDYEKSLGPCLRRGDEVVGLRRIPLKHSRKKTIASIFMRQQRSKPCRLCFITAQR